MSFIDWYEFGLFDIFAWIKKNLTDSQCVNNHSIWLSSTNTDIFSNLTQIYKIFCFTCWYRGRWNAGATSPRFRGRGFAPNQMGQQIRGRGGPPFFRGGSRAGAPRFPNSNNFDPNWNAPPMYGNSHMGFGNQQGDQNSGSFHQVRIFKWNSYQL